VKGRPSKAGSRTGLGHLERRVFHLWVLLLTVATLWPIWTLRLLPMQDYPQHLFLSQVIATYDAPALDWKLHYDIDLGLRPYMLWYLVMKPLAALFGVEAAGKLVFSLYVVLITALVLACRRVSPRGSLPWGALLLYPFAFNQMYFMGFTNYIVSLPLLFLAVMDLESLATRPSTVPGVALHALYLCILLLNHPYTALVYFGLAVAASSSVLGDWKAFARTLAPSIVLALIFVVWSVTQPGQSPPSNAYHWGVRWWPFWRGTLAYYLLMFTGMRWTRDPDWLSVGLWACAAGALCVSWLRSGTGAEGLRRPLLLFLASLSGFLGLPFWLGYYSYVNLRLAPVSYFALALLLSRLRCAPWAGCVAASCAALLVSFSIGTQASVSREVEEVLPALAKAQRNSLVLPLMFDSSSAILDPEFFYQFHVHEVSYYHVLVGGGADPELFPNQMLPVHYRTGFSLPSPEDPRHFSWDRYGPYYDYFLARGAPPAFAQYMTGRADLVATSGPWELFRNRFPAKPQ
jgi:hypothetical protein